VWLVELGPLRDRLHVASVTASTLGLDDASRLERFVADKALLVILDNCEHVLDEAARVVERLLQAGRRVRVVATSREHLGLPGEAVWTLPQLAPEEAARLFLARARAVSADVAVEPSALVDRICERLDGLPLAVELAAARTRSLSLRDIVDRIDDRVRLLTAGARTAHPRQQTLRGVVDWSYDLLLAEEQRVFRRLAVFAGGFDLAAAEAVCAGDDVAVEDVVDVVGRLVDKSLVAVVHRDASTRYRLLETLAEYGRARLAEAGEAAATSDRHLRWMVELAGRAEPGLRGVDQPRWTARLGAELENARAALEWAIHRGSAADAVALAGGLAYGWYITGLVQEGRAFITRALARSGEASAEQRAIAGAWGGWLTQIGSGATGDAVALCEEAVATARGRTVRGFCTAAVVAALLRAYRGQTVEAIELIEDAAAVLADSPDRWSQAYVDWVRSGLRLKTGDAEQARQLLERSFRDFAAEGDRYGQAITSIRLGELAEMRGDLDEAIAATTFAYEGTMSTGRGANASILATRLGNLAALQGRFDDAEAWHEMALTRARELSFPGPAAQALSGMAVAAELQGRRGDAEAVHREALAAYEAVGSAEGAAFTLACLGALAAAAGDGATAAALHHESLARAVAGSDRRAIGFAVLGLAGVQAIEGDGCSAALLVGAASQIRGEVDPPGAPFRRERERVEAWSRSLIGDGPFAAARESGRRQADTVLARLTSGEPLPD
jgi:predicted ATPase